MASLIYLSKLQGCRIKGKAENAIFGLKVGCSVNAQAVMLSEHATNNHIYKDCHLCAG